MTNVKSLLECEEICQTIRRILEPVGFECYPFKIGWYNENVSTPFRLNYEDDVIAFIIISTPAMFDRAFKPFVLRVDCCSSTQDLIDQCMKEQFKLVKEALPEAYVECIHDFEMHHSRRPKVLVQTAGHIAGAAYYYQRKDVNTEPWAPDEKIFGVSIHPKYGGWFALRGIFILRDVVVPDLPRRLPPDVVPNNELRIELLNRFNKNWQDWTFRDIIPAEDRYSEEQKLYFSTPPKDRKEILISMKESRAAENENRQCSVSSVP